LQPQNLVMMGSFPNCDVKLCDFEISRVILEGTEVREILGTPDYVGKTSHSPPFSRVIYTGRFAFRETFTAQR
jgi:hypothetical protein